MWLRCFIRAALAERHPSWEDESGWGGRGSDVSSRQLHQHDCLETQRMSSDSDLSFLFCFLSSPSPTPICLIPQIQSHVTKRHLYNRGHPFFKLHSALFDITTPAKSSIDESILNWNILCLMWWAPFDTWMWQEENCEWLWQYIWSLYKSNWSKRHQAAHKWHKVKGLFFF